MPTITEKILSFANGNSEIKRGEEISIKLDYAIVNDVSGPLAASEFEKLETKIWDPSKVLIVPDNFMPPKDMQSANNYKQLKDFSKKYKIPNLFDGGAVGIEHELLVERGYIRPGMVIAAGDSHASAYGALGALAIGAGSTEMACALATGELTLAVPEQINVHIAGTTLKKQVYAKDIALYILGKIGLSKVAGKAVEITGDLVKEMGLSQRLTLTNMLADLGALSVIIEPDFKVLQYVKERSKEPYRIYKTDAGTEYNETLSFDAKDIEPVVALPHAPNNIKHAADVGVHVDQVVIGGCTSGKLDDLKVAASILKGKRIAPGVRLIVVPATQEVYKNALVEDLFDIFISAGAIISSPTNGVGSGAHLGVLAENEVCLTTTDRNFVGRMGHQKSKVYIASPATAAATAIVGKITDPRTI